MVLTTVLAATVIGSTLTLKSGNHKIIVPAYTAIEIVDGDTFKTSEKQIIRIDGIDAPEIDRCGGPEAKQYLTDLISNKPLYLKIIFRDPYQRLVSEIYNPNGSVSELMLSSGNAMYSSKQGTNDKLKKLSNQAKENKLGIYSSKCTQAVNPDNPKCDIKGNINIENGTKLFRSDNCGQYNLTAIELYKGDQWFCSEKEALNAGFTKSQDCPQK